MSFVNEMSLQGSDPFIQRISRHAKSGRPSSQGQARKAAGSKSVLWREIKILSEPRQVIPRTIILTDTFSQP